MHGLFSPTGYLPLRRKVVCCFLNVLNLVLIFPPRLLWNSSRGEKKSAILGGGGYYKNKCELSNGNIILLLVTFRIECSESNLLNRERCHEQLLKIRSYTIGIFKRLSQITHSYEHKQENNKKHLTCLITRNNTAKHVSKH